MVAAQVDEILYIFFLLERVTNGDAIFHSPEEILVKKG
jgi:hypothetical protein